jgi:hypothetical protein
VDELSVPLLLDLEASREMFVTSRHVAHSPFFSAAILFRRRMFYYIVMRGGLSDVLTVEQMWLKETKH